MSYLRCFLLSGNKSHKSALRSLIKKMIKKQNLFFIKIGTGAKASHILAQGWQKERTTMA